MPFLGFHSKKEKAEIVLISEKIDFLKRKCWNRNFKAEKLIKRWSGKFLSKDDRSDFEKYIEESEMYAKELKAEIDNFRMLVEPDYDCNIFGPEARLLDIKKEIRKLKQYLRK